jgi:integrase
MNQWVAPAGGLADCGVLAVQGGFDVACPISSLAARRFRESLTGFSYCDELDLSPGLDLHSLRRSYATHLLEAGWDAMFVQNQMGHEHASTRAIYTCVTSDYRTRTLRNALDATIAAALGKTQDGGTA